MDQSLQSTHDDTFNAHSTHTHSELTQGILSLLYKAASLFFMVNVIIVLYDHLIAGFSDYGIPFKTNKPSLFHIPRNHGLMVTSAFMTVL